MAKTVTIEKQMPCRHCGESAREKHGGVVGPDLHYDDDGEAHYTCLDCLVEILEKEMEQRHDDMEDNSGNHE